MCVFGGGGKGGGGAVLQAHLSEVVPCGLPVATQMSSCHRQVHISRMEIEKSCHTRHVACSSLVNESQDTSCARLEPGHIKSHCSSGVFDLFQVPENRCGVTAAGLSPSGTLPP